MNLSERVRRARRWARVAGARALEAYGDVVSERKGPDKGLVTELDRSIEQFLRGKIKTTYPGERVVGEEYDPEGESGQFTWYLDPIDGTAAYSMTLPIWTVCIGMAHDTQPVAGVMWSPAVNDEYYGWSDGGFDKNNTRLSDSPLPPEDWDDETLLCVRSDSHRRFDIDFVGKCRSLGSSAYHMGLVLDRRAAGALLGRLHAWDVAAACGIASGTPFELRTFDGDKPDWENLSDGNYSREQLLFAHDSVIGDLRERVQLKE